MSCGCSGGSVARVLGAKPAFSAALAGANAINRGLQQSTGRSFWWLPMAGLVLVGAFALFGGKE